MPSLNWIGKDKIINHHQDVPYHILEFRYAFGEPDSGGSNGNMIIKGDNLHAPPDVDSDDETDDLSIDVEKIKIQLLTRDKDIEQDISADPLFSRAI